MQASLPEELKREIQPTVRSLSKRELEELARKEENRVYELVEKRTPEQQMEALDPLDLPLRLQPLVIQKIHGLVQPLREAGKLDDPTVAQVLINQLCEEHVDIDLYREHRPVCFANLVRKDMDPEVPAYLYNTTHVELARQHQRISESTCHNMNLMLWDNINLARLRREQN